MKYKDAFSLRDEIGLCPNMEIELELNDETPFFIRPFSIKESEKDVVDMEMRKGCLEFSRKGCLQIAVQLCSLLGSLQFYLE